MACDLRVEDFRARPGRLAGRRSKCRTSAMSITKGRELSGKTASTRSRFISLLFSTSASRRDFRPYTVNRWGGLDDDDAGLENERHLLDNLSVTVSDIVVHEDIAICRTWSFGARSSTFAEAPPQMRHFATETEKICPGAGNGELAKSKFWRSVSFVARHSDGFWCHVWYKILKSKTIKNSSVWAERVFYICCNSSTSFLHFMVAHGVVSSIPCCAICYFCN